MLYRSHKSKYFSIATHFVVIEYAHIIFNKCLVLIFAYVALMAPCRKYRQMLTWVRLQVHADSMKLAETMLKLI